MIYYQTSSAGRKLRVLTLVPAIWLALALCSIPAVASMTVATPGEVTETAEEIPQFPGGDSAMFEYLTKNLKYPAKAAAANEEGRVVVKFVVEADGSIGETEIIRSASPSLDAEAVRLIKSMPRWTPGKINGQAVACTYTLPINFKLSSGKKKAK